MSKIIWLDDLRDPKDYGYPDAIWFKTSQDFLASEYMQNTGNKSYRWVSEWRFDNNLGEESEQEGYDCFCKLEELLTFGKPPVVEVKIYVHSSNPSAVQKFMGAKESFKSRFEIDIIRVQY